MFPPIGSSAYVSLVSAAVFSCAFLAVFATDEAHPPNSTSADDPASLELTAYRAALRIKRIEQRKAVLKLSEIGELKKQIKMLDPVVKKMMEVLRTKKDIVQPVEISQLSKDDLSLLIENILFLSDLILKLPDSSKKLLKKYSDAQEVIVSSAQFAEKTGFLESIDLHALHLMLQEMDFVPRSDDYINVNTIAYKQKKEEELRIAKSRASKEIKKNKTKNVKRTLMSGPSAGEL